MHLPCHQQRSCCEPTPHHCDAISIVRGAGRVIVSAGEGCDGQLLAFSWKEGLLIAKQHTQVRLPCPQASARSCGCGSGGAPGPTSPPSPASQQAELQQLWVSHHEPRTPPPCGPAPARAAAPASGAANVVNLVTCGKGGHVKASDRASAMVLASL
jgi:hypothetical protein